VQGDAGHPGLQGGGQENNTWKKGRAKEEEEKHKGSLTQKSNLNLQTADIFIRLKTKVVH
jgi:hypothetical protein